MGKHLSVCCIDYFRFGIRELAQHASNERHVNRVDELRSELVNEVDTRERLLCSNYYLLVLLISSGSNILKSPRGRRVRTTSMSQPNKKTTAESILHADRRTIYTAGRPPWYNCTGGQEVEPFVIGNLKI